MARNPCFCPAQAGIVLLLALSTDILNDLECVPAHLPDASRACFAVDEYFPAVVSSERLVFHPTAASTSASTTKAHLSVFPANFAFSGHWSSTSGMARNPCFCPAQAAIVLLLALSTDSPQRLGMRTCAST
ncbi:hypothetical protein MTO96_024889 [Rhipicephalus appendiculatus]